MSGFLLRRQCVVYKWRNYIYFYNIADRFFFFFSSCRRRWAHVLLILHLPPPPKLQLAAEQPSTGECWIPPKKDTPHPTEKEKPQQDGRRGNFTFRIKPYTRQRHLEGSNKPCVHQDSKTPQRLSQNCLSISCGGMGLQWPATGVGALGAADLGMA